ncbi:hypothetical protein [Nostoc sp. C110]|uniref:hypothetical protein n=1 Tax=Nostoc sp. C110 TaxID=3349876 RepID=UPI00370D3968
MSVSLIESNLQLWESELLWEKTWENQRLKIFLFIFVMSSTGRHLSWKAGKNNANILLEALHCLADGDLDGLGVTPHFIRNINSHWEEKNLWVTKATLYALSCLTEKQGKKLEPEQIRNALHCLEALGFLEDKRGASNSKTKTSSKNWCFVLKFNHQEKQENLYWLFGRKDEEGEWERRRVYKDRVLQPKSQKISLSGSIAIPEAEDSIEKRGNEITPDEKAPNITTLYVCNDDPCFVGREETIAKLDTLFQQGAKTVLILGEGGIGKTTLAWQYLKHFELFIDYRMAKEAKDVTPAEVLLEDCLKRFFNEDLGCEFGIALDSLRRKLQNDKRQIGILIDNLEPALQNGHFIEEHKRYIELLRVLSDTSVKSTTLITSREPLYEPGVVPYILGELSSEAWRKFLESRGVDVGKESTLSQIHKSYGGNAEFMNVLSSAIWNECQGSLERYWQKNQNDLLLNPTLEAFIKRQFNKLESDNIQAYQLLYRLGCCRYQDVPFVMEEGLSYLLWDVEKDKDKKRVIKALGDRSLIKTNDEGYYLHPVIRAEAIERLESSKEWKQCNQSIADFYFNKINDIEDDKVAKFAFEAFYHYESIQNIQKCFSTLIKILGAEDSIENIRISINLWKHKRQILYMSEKILESLDDAERILVLIPASVVYTEIGEIKKALQNTEKILELKNKFNTLNTNIIFAWISAHSIASKSNRILGKFQDSLEDGKKAFQVAKSNNFQMGKAIALYELGTTYIEMCKPEIALEHYLVAAQEAINAQISEEDYDRLIKGNKIKENLSIIVDNILQKYITDCKKNPAQNIWCYRILYSISSCFNIIGSYKFSKIFAIRALSFVRDEGNKAWVNLLLGDSYSGLGIAEKASKHYQEAMKFIKNSSDIFVNANVLKKNAEFHQKKFRIEEALETYKELENILHTTDYTNLKANTFYNIGLIYYQKDELIEALSYCDRSIGILAEVTTPLLTLCQELQIKIIKDIQDKL